MAGRKAKAGLDYFSFDTSFFSDLRIRKLIKYQSGKAVTVYAYLLCTIYEQGYYMRWDNELPFIISEATGYDEAYIQEVVKCCMNIGLFSKDLFETEGVLTSKGIQERYDLLVKLKKWRIKISEFSLISSEEMVINSEEMKDLRNLCDEREREKERENERRKGKKSTSISSEEIPPDLKTGKGEEESPPVAAAPPFFLPTFVDIDLLKEKVFSDKDFFVRIYVGWGLSQDYVYEWLVAFNSWLRYQGEVKKLEKDYRKHFGNWLKTQDLQSNPKDYSPITKPENGNSKSNSGGGKSPHGQSAGAIKLARSLAADLGIPDNEGTGDPVR